MLNVAKKIVHQEQAATLLDEGCEFQGKLSFEGQVRIDGQFQGEILSQDCLIVGEAAVVEADVAVGVLELNGTLKGKVNVKGKTLILSHGRLEGHLHTSELEVQRGAVLNGTIEMSSRAQKEEVPPSFKQFGFEENN